MKGEFILRLWKVSDFVNSKITQSQSVTPPETLPEALPYARQIKEPQELLIETVISEKTVSNNLININFNTRKRKPSDEVLTEKSVHNENL